MALGHELGEGFLPLHIEAVDEAALYAFGDVEEGGGLEVLLARGVEVVLPLVEIASCTAHGFGIGEVARREVFEPRYAVEPFANAEDVAQLVGGEILVEHGETVAEIEVGFPRMLSGECAAADVVDDRLGDAHNFSRSRSESPTEIDLFEVGEEVRVEASDGVPVGGANEQCGAGSPEEGTHGVVLPVVFLEDVEHAAAAEGIAVAVDESACGTGVFETVVRPFGVDLRLGSRHFGMRVHVGAQWGEPAGGGAHIAVEEEIIVVTSGRFGFDAAEGGIVAFGKAVVFVEAEETHVRMFGTQVVERGVGRPVVGYNDFALVGAVAHDTRQITAEHVNAVPVENHNSNHG